MTSETIQAHFVATRERAARVGLCVAILLVVAAMAVPAVTGWDVRAGAFPPLHSIWVPRVGPGTPLAVLLGVLACVWAERAARWSWPQLLGAVYLFGVLWMLALATVDGIQGIGGILDAKTEYLQTARSVTDVGALLRGYIDRIPLDSTGHWPVHIAGHPPAALLFFTGLVRIGLGSALAAGMVVTFVAASTTVATLLVARRLGGETPARAAAPFLAVGPAAIWMCVSADAMFAAVAAWATLLLACAATSRRNWVTMTAGLGAGVLYGMCLMLSYGLPILGILAVIVLALARAWRPLPWVAAGVIIVVAGFAMLGFAWWEALPVLRNRYWAGIAQHRPGLYWTWADLAAVTVSAGPWVGAGIAVAIVDVRRSTADEADTGRRVVAWLAIAGALMCAAAAASQMSRAEVERIWLPFVPWMLLATGLLPPPWRRVGLIVQVAFAIVVQTLLYTRW
ncbi:hypothetical protein ACH3VR_07700 [Microbacterium sp. B2969]|uniref:Glycosyltransferase RgtA/B/C/D-like domain-containing protein n=1 Tax=Microbacterium alkaliflavum TaxID=3248839 RepID=A0ABW7Q766_9MICO